MKTIALHQVDAFTNTLFGGNPAGVVTNAAGLDETVMRQVAREMNLSETAFVLPPSTDQADVRMRYFTPAGSEIDFCGHATVGSLFQLAQLSLYNLGQSGDNTVRVETKAGILPMSVANGENGPRISFVAPEVDMQPYHMQGKDFAEALGIPATALKTGSTILVDRALNYVYIPVTSLVQLGDLTFDFPRIRKNFGKEGVVVFCLFTNETKQPDSDLHARGLAPNVGIDEDPFTGSMQAGLVHAAKRNKLVSAAQQETIVEQGHSLDRPGYATIHHDSTTDQVRVTAQAVKVFSTEMEL
jgi:PhzF family phenazine biosynthesis protein